MLGFLKWLRLLLLLILLLKLGLILVFKFGLEIVKVGWKVRPICEFELNDILLRLSNVVVVFI